MVVCFEAALGTYVPIRLYLCFSLYCHLFSYKNIDSQKIASFCILSSRPIPVNRFERNYANNLHETSSPVFKIVAEKELIGMHGIA